MPLQLPSACLRAAGKSRLGTSTLANLDISSTLFPSVRRLICSQPRVGYSLLSSYAVAWSLLAIPLFCMPLSIPVSATTANYAAVVFVAATAISSLWYWAWGHKNYAGPPVQGQHQHNQ